LKRPQKITLGEMREMGVRGVLVYCSVRRHEIHHRRRALSQAFSSAQLLGAL
jgi:hypothetical protein